MTIYAKRLSCKYETGAITGCLSPSPVQERPPGRWQRITACAGAGAKSSDAGLFHLKAAGRRWAPDATFFHACANNAAEQRLGQQTRLRMICRSGSDWTAAALNEVLAIFFTKCSRAAQVFENAQCSIDSLPTGFALQVRQMFPGYRSSSGAHSGA